MRSVERRLALLLVLGLIAPGWSQGASGLRPFKADIHWRAGDLPRPWTGTIRGSAGEIAYAVKLLPLWRLEGGIVALELVVSDPRSPDENLLGDRVLNKPQAFVVTLDDLAAGIEKSKHGAVRTFLLPGKDGTTLHMAIGEHLTIMGRTVGCPTCASIGALHITLTAK